MLQRVAQWRVSVDDWQWTQARCGERGRRVAQLLCDVTTAVCCLTILYVVFWFVGALGWTLLPQALRRLDSRVVAPIYGFLLCGAVTVLLLGARLILQYSPERLADVPTTSSDSDVQYQQ